ncbi:unnamed protein product [Durusdinium trenchii]|uniref:Zinc-finger domain-containing protein n=1 Tax=Durusdinium trenchii TaxID=1381693 RepID=A0ABP0MSX8_9DINO
MFYFIGFPGVKYHFDCCCPACIEPNEVSDQRRIDMRKFDREIDKASPQECLQLVEDILQLYDDEDVQLQALRGRACLDACAACARLRDDRALRHWAQPAQQHYTWGLGPLHALTRKAASYASAPQRHQLW